MFMAMLALAAAALGQEPKWHIETTEIRHIVAVREVSLKVPNMTVSNWAIYAGYPPELPGQSLVKIDMAFPGHSGARISKYIERSEDKRPVLLGLQPANDAELAHGYSVRVTYEMLLRKRELKPGPPKEPVVALRSADRRRWTRSDDQIDYDAPKFQTWLASHGLRRKAEEDDVTYVKRALKTIHQEAHYGEEPIPKLLSEICDLKAHYCGGFSWTLVGTLRANGIPARALVGHMASKSGDDVHVTAEAYLDGIGWLEIEATSEMLETPPPFIAFHTDNNLLLEGWRGESIPEMWLQPVINAPQAVSGGWDGFQTTDVWTVTTQ